MECHMHMHTCSQVLIAFRRRLELVRPDEVVYVYVNSLLLCTIWAVVSRRKLFQTLSIYTHTNIGKKCTQVHIN